MLIVVCFFYTLQSCRLHFPRICTICQLTLSEGQVGTRAEVKEKAFPSFSLRMVSNLRRSDCSPILLLSIRVVTFNWTSTVNMWKIKTGKVCQMPPPPNPPSLLLLWLRQDDWHLLRGDWKVELVTNSNMYGLINGALTTIRVKTTVCRHVLQCTFVHSDQCCGRSVPSTLHPANRGSRFCREVVTCPSSISYLE